MQINEENEILDNRLYDVAEMVHSYESRLYMNLAHEMFSIIDCLEFIKRQDPDLERIIDAHVNGAMDILEAYGYAKADFDDLSDNQKRQHYYKIFHGSYRSLF